MNIESIQKCTKAQVIQYVSNDEIEDYAIDSRKIKPGKIALFIALSDVRDGHQFIQDAYQKGVRNFLVASAFDYSPYADCNILQVSNTLDALQQIAITHRLKFELPVIGITGSNGKTIVKEWLYQLLSDQYDIVKSPKSYNSQIGVPLSILKIQNHHNLGIFEAGISQPGEMTKSRAIIRPTIGIFTNIGLAHSEGFLNLRQKINEKLFLFRNADILIYCKDHLELHETILQYRQQIKDPDKDLLKLFDWSRKTNATLRITNITTEDKLTTIEAKYHESDISIQIPFSDAAYLENAINCWCLLLYIGLDNETIRKKMISLTPVAMRLELKHGINGCTLINDTYNSDLTSLQIAIDFLEQQQQQNKKSIILSDIFQIGMPDAAMYEEIAHLLEEKQISKIIGIGSNISKYSHLFQNHNGLNALFFETTEDFLLNLHGVNFENEVILLKGSRAFKFEKIEKILVQKLHNTILEISLSAMQHNLNYFRNQVPKPVKIMAMVKAYSYGSGSFEIANLLQFAGVDYLTVAYLDEGIALRKAGITLPIMVMSPDLGSFDRMIAWKLEPEIYNLLSLYEILNVTKTFEIQAYPIHIKLDTGMHRLGFTEEDLSEVLPILKESKEIKVKSIFSHLVGSDNATLDEFTNHQAALFSRMSDQIIATIGYKPLRHLANTAAIIHHKLLHFDMVRLGIGLYGISNDDYVQSQLEQIGTLKTHIAQIKNVKAGESVGYNRGATLKTDSKIATVNIGYADGYFRDFGNGNAYMLVNGKKAPVVGVVCMDMCMLDITGINDVSEGDEVIVFGKDLPINQLSKWANTIPYEILTGISQRVKRVYIND